MNRTIAIGIVIILIGAGIWYWYGSMQQPVVTGGNPNQTATSTQTTSFDGTLTFTTPSNFGLAVTPEQVMVQAYIPPCDSGFSYCLYYNSADYANTNFESAGVAIRGRDDLLTKSACLTTQPDGYTGLTATTTDQTNYSMSVFAPIGDAGAGHYATGAEYRLFTNNRCYQFDTRIGETQYANYPAGTKVEFTDANRTNMMNMLRGIISSMTLNQTGETLMLPQ